MYLTNPHSGRHPTLHGLIHQQITAVAQNGQHCSAKATTLCHSGHSARGLLSLACAVQADCACRDTPTMCKTRTPLAKTPTWPGDQPGTIHSSDGEPHDLRCDSNCAILIDNKSNPHPISQGQRASLFHALLLLSGLPRLPQQHITGTQSTQPVT